MHICFTGSSKKWKQNDSDDDDDESIRSSVQKPHSTRARWNKSKRSFLKRSRDVLTPEATTSSLHHSKRKSTGVVEPNSGRKTRGRPPRLSLESAVLRGKRKIPSDWNDGTLQALHLNELPLKICFY